MPTPSPLLLATPALLTLLLAAPAAFAQAPAAHWSFDRVEKNAYPSSGSPSLPAAVSGAVSSVAGVAGRAASFTETPAGQLLLPVDLATLSRDGSFTIEFWLRPMGRSHPYGTCIDAGGSRGFVIRTNNGGRLSFSSNREWNVVTTEFPLNEQTWTHVALVHRGGSATLYVAGRPVGSHPVEITGLPPSLQVGSVLETRRLPDGGTVEEMTKTFVGDIDELKIHARALGESDIASLAKPVR